MEEDLNEEYEMELSNQTEEPYYLSITNIKELNDNDSFTVARVTDDVNCVELHFDKGEATIEYDTKVKSDEWENDMLEEADWFNKDMSEEEVENKLWELFDNVYGTSLNTEEEMEI